MEQYMVFFMKFWQDLLLCAGGLLLVGISFFSKKVRKSKKVFFISLLTGTLTVWTAINLILLELQHLEP